MIFKAAIEGNWVLLENLHLVTEFIPELEKYLLEMYKEDSKETAKLQAQGKNPRKTVAKM